jgi:hypothetical protein
VLQGSRRLLLVLGASAVAGLVLAPAARAGTVTASRSGDVVTLQGSSASDSVRIAIAGAGGPLRIYGQFGSNVDAVPAGGCADAATPTDAVCGEGVSVTTIVIRAGAGDDTFAAQLDSVGDNPDVQAFIDADMGAGDDGLFVAADSQAASAIGGDGSDSLSSGPAVDRLEGGPGSDTLSGGLGSDELLGGADFDTAFYTDHTGNLVLDLDGQRDDGDPALGEADLLLDIEGLTGGSGDDIITGDDGLNDLNGADGSDRIDGRGGFDRLFGDFQGGTGGNDTIFARDGLADTIDCADGSDIAFTDDIDIPFECEDRRSSPDLQPDRDGDGLDKPLDCNDLDGTVKPGAFDRPGDGIDQNCDGADAIDTDRDRDGFQAGFDCDDGRRDVHPGAVEVLGNRVDEDCDGVADPFAAFPTVALLSARIGFVTDVVGLVLVDLDGGERVRIGCKGAGCRFKTRRRKAGRRAESLILDKQVRGQRLRPGARISVRITRADGVRKTITFTARANRPPKQRTRCDAPGDGKVARC